MTLLRMLAFAPDERQAGAVPAASGAPAGQPEEQPDAPGVVDVAPESPAAALPGAEAGRELRQRDAAATLPEPPPERHVRGAATRVPTDADPEPAASTNWNDLVAELDLGGVARMIAEHSILVDDRDAVYRLMLDHAHDTLLSDAPVAAIERALADKGRPGRVQVEVGPVTRETPAQRFQRLRAERQQAAEETLATDSTVRTLLSEFGGRLDGVSPVE
jgi:DNA polymerase-3 subunit gamma/tau